jgi:hypothetical protein
MQVFDAKIYEIVEHGLEGNGLSREETRALFSVPERTKEAALIRWAGQELSLKAADGIAEIHGQIGLNATKCPMDCKFCSFAKSADCRTEDFELTRDEVIEYAKIQMENRVNLILLLCTASYRFDKLLDRKLRHEQVSCRCIDTSCVLIGAENTDFAVFASEGFHTFKNRLSVVQNVGGDRDIDVVAAAEFSLIPFAVGIMETDIAACRHECKTEFIPFDIHFYTSFIIWC